MKTYPDCIPCFVRQSLEAARLVNDDPSFHEEILRRACQIAAELDYSAPPPAMGRDIHRLIRRLSGVEDPYREAKARFNDFILGLMPGLKKQIEQSADPFETALKLAIAGNVIDFGVNINLTSSDIENAVRQALALELDKETVAQFKSSLANASRILYVGDNAGEVVFDRVFIETIKKAYATLDITFIVRGAPILNDVTLGDARQAGMHETAKVVANGSDAPGCLLDDCSEEFHNHLSRADLIISKGQGNYETLSELPHEIYFLLKAKCVVIARDIGAAQGDFLLVRKAPGEESGTLSKASSD